MMQTYLFDDNGDLWDAKSRRLAEVLQASIGGDELLNYVIRNLGFVGISEASDSVRIRLRPSVVSQTAFSALLYWLHDRPIKRVLLSLLGTDWSHELLGSRDEAVQRLMASVPFKSEDREGDFLRQTRPLDDLPTGGPLRALLAHWSETGGKFDRERAAPLLENALDRRFVLVEAASHSPSVYFKDVGRGLAQLADYWLSQSINLRVEDQPDYAYGKWVSDIYREVIATGKPSLEEIDAVVTWPENRRESFRYRRLVVPFRGLRNSNLALSATVIDLDVNLRRKPG
jgi:hypothetical protein